MYFCIVNDTTCDLALRYVLLRELVRIASSSPSIDMMLVSWCQLQQFWDCPYKFNKRLGGDSSNRYFWLQLLTAWIFFLPGKWFVIGALFVPCDTVAIKISFSCIAAWVKENRPSAASGPGFFDANNTSIPFASAQRHTGQTFVCIHTEMLESVVKNSSSWWAKWI